MKSSRPTLLATTFTLLQLVCAPALAQEETDIILPQGQLAISAERLVSASVTLIPERTHVTYTDEATGASGRQEWSASQFKINPGSKIGVDYVVWKGLTLGASAQYIFESLNFHDQMFSSDGSLEGTGHSTSSMHQLGLGARVGYAISGDRFGIWPRVGIDQRFSWYRRTSELDGMAPESSTEKADAAAFTGEVVGLYRPHDKLALALTPYVTISEDRSQQFGLWAGLVILP